MSNLQYFIKSTIEQRALFSNVPTGYVVIKRVFDITAAIVGLIVLLPLFVIVSFAIKYNSPGPVMFFQQRCGQNGKNFKMYKFRSMVMDAEELLPHLESKNEVKGHMFKLKNDPRVTKVGSFLRKTSIDELPQLFNVVKGEMSIVGPRPPIMREVMKYEPWHYLRLSVKPGITGLWQINGRNSVGFEEMVRMDLKYIRERNLWYDLKIIIKTVPVLFGDNKAY